MKTPSRKDQLKFQIEHFKFEISILDSALTEDISKKEEMEVRELISINEERIALRELELESILKNKPMSKIV